jgi:hypothetical protein
MQQTDIKSFVGINALSVERMAGIVQKTAYIAA